MRGEIGFMCEDVGNAAVEKLLSLLADMERVTALVADGAASFDEVLALELRNELAERGTLDTDCASQGNLADSRIGRDHHQQSHLAGSRVVMMQPLVEVGEEAHLRATYLVTEQLIENSLSSRRVDAFGFFLPGMAGRFASSHAGRNHIKHESQSAVVLANAGRLRLETAICPSKEFEQSKADPTEELPKWVATGLTGGAADHIVRVPYH